MGATATKKAGAGNSSAGKATQKKDSKIKTAAQNTVNKVKKATGDYKEAIKQAHRKGFNDGYDAADKLPERRGARQAATLGYNGGIKTRQQEKKLAAKKAKNK